MYFKVYFTTLALIALSAGVGCARSHVPSSAGGLQMGGNESGCLSKSKEVASRYLDGLASETETSEAWNCAIRSLELFTNRTHGQTPGVYTPGELRSFLEYFNFVDSGIPDRLLQEAMEVKRVFIGGRTDVLTISEIQTAKALLGTFRDESLRLRTFMPVTADGLAHKSEPEMEKALTALRASAGELGASLERTGTPYSFERLSALLGEIEKYVTKPPEALVMAHHKIASIQALKSTLISPDRDRIAGYEWSTVLTTASRWYAILVRFQALTLHFDSMIQSPGRDHAVDIGRDAFALIDEAVARHPRSQISFAELDLLLEALFPKGYEYAPDATVTLPHLKSAVRTLIQRFFGGAELGPTGRAATGLTRRALDRTWKAIEHWSEGQRYLEAMFSVAEGGSAAGSSSLASFTPATFKPLTPAYLFSTGALSSNSGAAITPALEDAASRLQQIILDDRPLFWGQDQAITFKGAMAERRHSLHGLTITNSMYELARVLMRGYAEDPARANPTDESLQAVSFEEFKHFVGDIHDVLDDIRFVDPKDNNLAEKRFREASLFTFSATGAPLMTTSEGAQLLSLMYSGKKLSSDIHEGITAAGCGQDNPKLDPYGMPLLRAKCYREHYFGNVKTYWKNSPGLLKYYQGLQDWQRADFNRQMEDAARKIGFSEAAMNSSDSEGFAMIAQYIEVIFSRFDLDESGTLDWSEADAAFPVFKNTLAEISCQMGHCLSSDGALRSVFTYMLAHGKAPSGTAYIRWRFLPIFRSFYCDRGRIMQIFGELGKPSH